MFCQQHPTVQRSMPYMNNFNLSLLMRICGTFHLVRNCFQIYLTLIFVLLVLAKNCRKLFLLKLMAHIRQWPDFKKIVLECCATFHHMFCQSYQHGALPSNLRTHVLVYPIKKRLEISFNELQACVNCGHSLQNYGTLYCL